MRKRSPKPLNSCCCCFALSPHSRHIALRGTPTWLEIENSECAGLHGSKLDCSHHSTWCARSGGSGISAASSPREKCFRVLGCTSCSEKARIGELGEMKPNQSANRMDRLAAHSCLQAMCFGLHVMFRKGEDLQTRRDEAQSICKQNGQTCSPLMPAGHVTGHLCPHYVSTHKVTLICVYRYEREAMHACRLLENCSCAQALEIQ